MNSNEWTGGQKKGQWMHSCHSHKIDMQQGFGVIVCMGSIGSSWFLINFRFCIW